MSIRHIGRTNDFLGNTLWEIVSNLKNFGVGRVVVRHMNQHYPEPSYLRILSVKACPTPPTIDSVDKRKQEDRKVHVTVEKVFRGRKFLEEVKVYSTSYKADYMLLSKKDEAEYCKIVDTREERIIAPLMELPPLLKEFVQKETGRQDVKMKVNFKTNPYKTARLASEGEKPNIEIPIGVGKPDPTGAVLYKGINI